MPSAMVPPHNPGLSGSCLSLEPHWCSKTWNWVELKTMAAVFSTYKGSTPISGVSTAILDPSPYNEAKMAGTDYRMDINPGQGTDHTFKAACQLDAQSWNLVGTELQNRGGKSCRKVGVVSLQEKKALRAGIREVSKTHPQGLH